MLLVESLWGTPTVFWKAIPVAVIYMITSSSSEWRSSHVLNPNTPLLLEHSRRSLRCALFMLSLNLILVLIGLWHCIMFLTNHVLLAYPSSIYPDGYRPIYPVILSGRARDRIQVIDEITQRYHNMCNTYPISNPIKMMDEIYNLNDDNKAITFGNEAWNRNALDEMFDQYRYYANRHSTLIPFTVLSYGRRLERGRRMFSQIGIDLEQSAEVTYPDIETAFDNRDWIASHVFTGVMNYTSAVDLKTTIQPSYTSLLSTLNQFEVMKNLANSTYPNEGVFIVEDDAIPVPDFKRKLAEVYRQMQMYHPEWDLVFVGTCFQLTGSFRIAPNLHRTNESRCFNAVIMSRLCAVRILELGAVTDKYLAIDHLVNHLIPILDLNTFWVEPPLIFEDSKQDGISFHCV